MYIVFEENSDTRFNGKRFELFRVRWDYETGDYIQDPNGSGYAIKDPETGRFLPFSDDPECFGKVTED